MLLAISDLSTALELSPHDSNALLLRGNAYKTLQNYPEAVLDFGRAIDALQLQHQQLQQHSAVEEPQSNHHSAGSTVNGKAAIGANGSGGGALSADEINAQLVLAYTQRGYCQRKREQFLLALQDYTQALLRAPQSIKAYNNRGFLYAKLGKYDEAIGDYTAAIALDPHNAYAYHNRGIAYDKLGLIDQAIADFGKVILHHEDDFMRTLFFVLRRVYMLSHFKLSHFLIVISDGVCFANIRCLNSTRVKVSRTTSSAANHPCNHSSNCSNKPAPSRAIPVSILPTIVRTVAQILTVTKTVGVAQRL